MFFTKTARIVAWLMLILGLLRTGTGFLVASFDTSAGRSWAAVQYLGSGTSGEAIEQGLYIFFLGIMTGVICEISRNLAERTK